MVALAASAVPSATPARAAFMRAMPTNMDAFAAMHSAAEIHGKERVSRDACSDSNCRAPGRASALKTCTDPRAPAVIIGNLKLCSTPRDSCERHPG